jgi:hypothetical protein
MTRRLVWAGVALLILASGSVWYVVRIRHCACVGMKPTLRALERLSEEDWATLDAESLEQLWPGAPKLPCDPPAESGIAAISASIGRCCNSCGTCGGPWPATALPYSSNEEGLEAVGLILCRRTAEGLLGEMERVVDAIIPATADPGHKGDGWVPAEDRITYSNLYYWSSRENTFMLRAWSAWADQGTWALLRGVEWFGTVDLWRRGPVEATESWPLDTGGSVQVLQIRVRDDPPDRDLWFSYLTQCLPNTDACLREEMGPIWPPLRERAEREGATVVYLKASDGFWGGATYTVQRDASADDGWEDLPWERTEGGGSCVTP